MKSQTMSMSARFLAGIVVSGFVGGISALSFAQPSLADPYETENVNPLEDFQTVDNPDPFSNGGGLGMFDLLHRSRLGINRNMNDFTTEQRQSINDEAAQFRAKQQLLIDGPSRPIVDGVTPEESQTTP